MKTVLVKYKVFQEAYHALLDGHWEEKSQVVEVEKVTDVNKRFSNITDVKVLE